MKKRQFKKTKFVLEKNKSGIKNRKSINLKNPDHTTHTIEFVVTMYEWHESIGRL